MYCSAGLGCLAVALDRRTLAEAGDAVVPDLDLDDLGRVLDSREITNVSASSSVAIRAETSIRGTLTRSRY